MNNQPRDSRVKTTRYPHEHFLAMGGRDRFDRSRLDRVSIPSVILFFLLLFFFPWPVWENVMSRKKRKTIIIKKKTGWQMAGWQLGTGTTTNNTGDVVVFGLLFHSCY